MTQPSTDQRVEVTIISILISALIIRCIYVFFDGFKICCEEVYDENCRCEYRRSLYYGVNSALTLSLCIFLIILLYEYYVRCKLPRY